jgi:translation initiation factor eIF-2B subunit alpha
MTTGTAPPTASSSSSGTFDIVSSYHEHLQSSLSLPHPIAAIHALCDLLSHPSTSPTTVSELITVIQSHSALLKASLASPVPATAGTDLFSRLVVSMDWRGGEDFQREKERLVLVAREYAEKTVPACRARICGRAGVFLKEGAVVLTHSYSRVVMQLLLSAARLYRNTLQVYVTESRPEGLGLRTYEELTKAGIPATLVLDTAVAYVMSRVDVVLVGSEGVVESGGVLNAVGTYQLGLIAKSLGKPFYAAAER